VRSSIRDRCAMSLLLSVLMAALFAAPALAVAGRGRDAGRVPSTDVAKPATDSVATGAPASVVVRRPDGRIRLGAVNYPGHPGPLQNVFVGNNVYNANGARQAANMLGGGGQDYGGFSGLFDISIQNDGNRLDRFRVKASKRARDRPALAIGRELGMRPLVERVLARREFLTA
jgi:hypothetical protein